ncbi:hypothetical protein PXW85_27235, partial [Klebsiella pneumoniae]|nr:hypothetical protein [Klebsiella pneumoniae]
DIGGSKIALGVFNQERRLQWEKRVATPKSSYEDFLQAVEALVQAFYNARRRQLQSPEIAPNAAHLALARLEDLLGDHFLLV